MADTRAQSLFVLILVQLCRSQAPDSPSESWYLANVVNDGFQPKPISEIFSTESPFSTNPIVVLAKSELPSSFSEDGRPINLSPLPVSSPTQPTVSTELLQTRSQFPSQPVTRTDFTEQFQPSTSPFDIGPTPERKTTTANQRPSTMAPSFHYDIIYENSHIQGVNERERGLFQNKPTQSVTSKSTEGIRLRSTVTRLPIRTSEKTTKITATEPSRKPTTRKLTTRIPSTTLPQSVSSHQNSTRYNNVGPLPLRIRVVGPKGSITNVHINPKIMAAPTTTTKKPTTKRTRKTPKPKKNNYDRCLLGCKAHRDPICAMPLSATVIDPDQLKGFPSVCHMACFNSYKKTPYEKLLDGRCGRLRTRIHAVDSKVKLKREDLNKTQYFLDGGDATVVEFSPFIHK